MKDAIVWGAAWFGSLWLFVAYVWHKATAALRGAVAAHLLRSRSEWVNSGEMAMLFGAEVYPVLARLVDDGLLDRREGPTSADRLDARGGYPVIYYRWRSAP